MSQEGLQFVKSSATYERQLSTAETKKKERTERTVKCWDNFFLNY